MSNTTAAIIGICIPPVVVIIVQIIVPWVERKIEQRRALKRIRELPYNKGERELSKNHNSSRI